MRYVMVCSAYSGGSGVELQTTSSTSVASVVLVLTRAYEGVTHYSNTINVLLGDNAAISGVAETYASDYYSVGLVHDNVRICAHIKGQPLNMYK
jgi:hypothetical protein